MINARSLMTASAAIVTFAAARPVQSQSVFLTDTAKVSLLHQLVARTGAVNAGLTNMEAAIEAQKVANPRVPAVFWDRMLQEAKARRGELEEMIVSAYVSYFTADDVRQMLAFYDSPLGAKMLAAQPGIMKQSMAAGQRWGAEIGMDVARKLQAEGVKFPEP